MDNKEDVLRKHAKINTDVSRFNFRNHTLVTTKQAMAAMNEYELSCRNDDCKDIVDKIECLVGYLDMWKSGKPIPPELNKVIDETMEWISNL